MAYITENQLSNQVDIPISLSSTDLRMGDWLTVASVKVIAPMRLTYKLANLQLSECTVDTASITTGNKIYGNLGLVYLALRRDYSIGSPGAAGGLDVLIGTSLSIFSRDATIVVTATIPGTYSWIVANNCQPSTDVSPIIPASTFIDFRVVVTGTARIELDSA